MLAALEDSRDDVFLNAREQYKINYEEDNTNLESLSFIQKLDFIFELCRGNKYKINTFYNSYIKNEELEYRDYLDGKKVAIVSPSAVETGNGLEIDSSDVIVRLNYSYHHQGFNLEHTGQRIDICYYNFKTFSKILMDKSKVPQDVKFVNFFKWDKDLDLISDKYRIAPSFGKISFSGVLFNMLLRVLIDLTLFKAKSIKIYNSNLMIAPLKSFNKYYQEISNNEEYKRYTKLVASDHEPTAQFLILKRIISNNVDINADQMLENVLSFRVDKYVQLMTDNYRI